MHLSFHLGLSALLVVASSALANDQLPAPHGPNPACGGRYYPASAVPAREEGVAIVTIWIDEAGKVTNVVVDQSSGFDDLDQATVRCVSEAWHFSPAMLNGTPVASTKRYKIDWKFNFSSEKK